jgi:hypothetical protein
VTADNLNKVTVPRVFAEKRVKAQAQWMVDMMEMMNNLVDKQGWLWFGSIWIKSLTTLQPLICINNNSDHLKENFEHRTPHAKQ